MSKINLYYAQIGANRGQHPKLDQAIDQYEQVYREQGPISLHDHLINCWITVAEMSQAATIPAIEVPVPVQARQERGDV